MMRLSLHLFSTFALLVGIQSAVGSQTLTDASKNGQPAAGPRSSPASNIAKPDLKLLQPRDVSVGEKLSLNGSNFNFTPNNNTVTIGGKKAQVQSASTSTIVVVIPADAPVGKQQVIVSIGSAKSNPLEVTVLGPPPELSSLSLSSAAPGASLTISGKHFSPNASENRVTISGAAAEVESASPGSLSVIIPTIESPQYGVAVSVKVGKQKSKNSLTIDIQSREY